MTNNKQYFYFLSFILSIITYRYCESYHTNGNANAIINNIPFNFKLKTNTKRSQLYSFTEKINFNSDLLKFGNKIHITLPMPSKKEIEVKDFLSQSHLIINTVWEKDDIRQISLNKYNLLFKTFKFPFLGEIKPSIMAKVDYNNDILSLESFEWNIKGSRIISDNKFLKSFDIKLIGEIAIDKENSNSNGIVYLKGWVDYRVQGTKPILLSLVPYSQKILESIIEVIQSRAQVYTKQTFSTRLLRGFQNYLLENKCLEPIESQINV